MLALSRKVNETIVMTFGDVKATITIMEMRDGKVRLAFDAPDEVGIDRLEVYEQKMKKLQDANCTSQNSKL